MTKRTPDADDLISYVLKGSFKYTSREVATRVGITIPQASQVWRAMGFADVGKARAFTDSDVKMLVTLMDLVRSGYWEFDDALEIVRSLGQTSARLADWQATTLGRVMAQRALIETAGSLHETEIPNMLAEAKVITPALEKLMVHAWRRHTAAAISRASDQASAGDEFAGQMTVGFADLVGFTRISRELPEDQLAELVQLFESDSSDVVSAQGGRLVKTLGDEVLFVHQKAEVVAEAALKLHDAFAGHRQVPKLRIGLATGAVISRMGDVFGTTVNRASRLTVMARPANTFVDASTMDLIQGNDRFVLKGVRPRPVRGFGLLRAWSLSRPKSG